MKYNYIKICNSLLKKLPERTQEVIVRRFGFNGKKESLEAIGKTFSITRERVRQIEKDGINSIDVKNQNELFDYFSKTLDSFDGVKRESDFISCLGDKTNHIFFLLYLSKDIKRYSEDNNFYSFYYKKNKKIEEIKKNINEIVKFLEKKQKPLSKDEIKSNFKKPLPDSYLNLSKKIKKDPENNIGLIDWLEINPKGTKDKAFLIFKKIGKPLHFAQVASLIENSPFNKSGEKVYVTTVHNELIKDSRFVLVGRGIYALKDWGYKEGMVKDIIYDVLKEKGPLAKEEILTNVLEKRLVQQNTIYLNLQDKKKFLRDEKGRYFVNQIEEV